MILRFLSNIPQLVNIRADKEGAWDFDDGAEYSDDEGDDGQLLADDKEGIADNVEDEPDLLAANSTDSEAEGEEPEELMTAQGKDFVRALKGEQNAVLDSELAELGLEEEEEEEGRTSPTSVVRYIINIIKFYILVDFLSLIFIYVFDFFSIRFCKKKLIIITKIAPGRFR